MKKFVLSLVTSMLAASIAVSAASTVNFEINSTNAKVITDEIKDVSTAHPIYVPIDMSYISAEDVKTFMDAEVVNQDIDATLSKNGVTYTVRGCINKDGVFYLPLRMTCQTLGFDVDYVYSYNSIIISDKPAPIKVEGKTGVSYDHLKFYFDRMNNSAAEVSEEVFQQAKEETVAGLAEFAVIYRYATGNDFSSTMINNTLKNEIKTNSQSFDVPELAALINEKLVVANMYTESIAQSLTPPSDEDLAYRYEHDFATAKHILILSTGGRCASDEEAKKEAERILKEVKAGKDFDSLVKEFGEDPGMESNPDGYTFTLDEMIPEFEDATFALKENEVSEIVETSYGYHIIKRLPNPEITKSSKEYITNKILNYDFNVFIESYIKNTNVEIDNEVIASIK